MKRWQFAMLALPLTVLTFGLFDVNRATVARQQLQDRTAVSSPATNEQAEPVECRIILIYRKVIHRSHS